MSYTFRHDQVLCPETSLLIDEDTRSIALWQAGECVTLQVFTDPEFRLLSLFFSRGRALHCTYGEALASLRQEPVEVCTASLQTAQAHDKYEELPHYHVLATMKPVITLLEGCQSRLHRLSLHMCALLGVGYVLTPYRMLTRSAQETL